MIQPRLDRKLMVLKRTVTPDGAGSPVETWAEQFILWAGRESAAGGEQFVANENRNTQAEQMRGRFIPCLEAQTATGEYRIRYNGRDYDLLSAIEDLRAGMSRRTWMIFTMSFVQGEPTLTTATIPVIA